MSVRYEEFEAAELKKAREQQAAYAADKRQQTEEQIRQLVAVSEGEQRAQKAAFQTKQRAEKQRYTAEYAQNALQGAVTRRSWQKKLSELGLTLSGLAGAAQRKADTQGRAADRVITAEQQVAVDALTQKLADALAASSASLQEQEAKLRAAAEKDILKHESALIKAARNRATSQYKSALAAEAKGVAVK